jgi:hypothetical protein
MLDSERRLYEADPAPFDAQARRLARRDFTVLADGTVVWGLPE